MQLKHEDKRTQGPRDVATALATATCALLGVGAPSAVLAQDIGKWDVDTAGLYYTEKGRVSDLSFNGIARTQPLEDRYLNMTFSFDSLSGASPNGAAPSATAQKFPRPITLTRRYRVGAAYPRKTIGRTSRRSARRAEDRRERQAAAAPAGRYS